MQTAETDIALEEADVIIAAGRGIGDPENLHLIRDVAGIFTNGAIGASRTVCDLGWLPYAHQIGVTGKTVATGCTWPAGFQAPSSILPA
jgi:electron transfer flavoprotein alpha subunit